MENKRSKRGMKLIFILFFIGICLILYPTVSNLICKISQTKVVEQYEDNLNSYDASQKSSVLAKAHAYNQSLEKEKLPLVRYEELYKYDDVLNVDEDGIMGYITIDKIDVNLPIYHGVTDDVLNNAAGHLPGTSLPVGGEGAHCVISAHRGSPQAKLFTDLDKMRIGDTFKITIFDDELWYRVYSIKEIYPEEIDCLSIEEGKDLCTLLTCTPYGVNTKRLLIIGRRCSESEVAEIKAGDSDKVNVYLSDYLAGLVVVIFVVVIVYFYRRSKTIQKR